MIPCTEHRRSTSLLSIRTDHGLLQLFPQQHSNFPENLEIIPDNANIVGADSNSDNEYEVDNTEKDPKYNSIVII